LRRLIVVLAALLAPAIFSAHAHGSVRYHTVRSGESLSSIAASFYGKKETFKLVALYNSIDHPEKIKPGVKILLPYSDIVTLQQGESLSAVAERVWKDSRLYPVLAKANGIRQPERVSAGTSLYVPVLVPYRLGQAETLSTVAKDLMGDLLAYEQIALVSGIKDPARVPIGTMIKVPVVIKRSSNKSVSPQPKRKTVSEKGKISARTSSLTGAAAELDRLISRAENEFRKGNFQNAKSMLLKIESKLVAKKHAGALRTLALCHYAYGDSTLALEALIKAYRLDPAFKPEPAMVNPELMSLYRKARGKARR